MNKPVREMTDEEFDQWWEWRREHPLYIDSDEFQGMSLSYVNPEYLQDAPPPKEEEGAPEG